MKCAVILRRWNEDGQPRDVTTEFDVPEFAHYQALENDLVDFMKGFRKGGERRVEPKKDLFARRGQLSSRLRGMKVVVVGAGAVGSQVAELLARGGVIEYVIVDPDVLELGNLVRHSLLMNDIQAGKACQLADRIRRISPHITATAISKSLSALDDADGERVLDADLIIDCTGSDDVIAGLHELTFSKGKWFWSISISLHAQRVYAFSAHTERFPSDEFNSAVEPWVKRDRNDNQDVVVPREGIGCWHLVFPASHVDVSLMTATAIKHLIKTTASERGESQLVVFEQRDEDGGVHRVQSAASRGSMKPQLDRTFRTGDGRFAVILNAATIERIVVECVRAGVNETGGVLAGSYSQNRATAVVTHATGPAEDSRWGRSWLFRGVGGLKTWLASLWCRGEYYLGEWHFHPNAAPNPSGVDAAQLKRIACSRGYNCPEPILVILGGDPCGVWSLSVTVYDSDVGNERVRPLELTEDDAAFFTQGDA